MGDHTIVDLANNDAPPSLSLKRSFLNMPYNETSKNGVHEIKKPITMKVI